MLVFFRLFVLAVGNRGRYRRLIPTLNDYSHILPHIQRTRLHVYVHRLYYTTNIHRPSIACILYGSRKPLFIVVVRTRALKALLRRWPLLPRKYQLLDIDDTSELLFRWENLKASAFFLSLQVLPCTYRTR